MNTSFISTLQAPLIATGNGDSVGEKVGRAVAVGDNEGRLETVGKGEAEGVAVGASGISVKVFQITPQLVTTCRYRTEPPWSL